MKKNILILMVFLGILSKIIAQEVFEGYTLFTPQIGYGNSSTTKLLDNDLNIIQSWEHPLFMVPSIHFRRHQHVRHVPLRHGFRSGRRRLEHLRRHQHVEHVPRRLHERRIQVGLPHAEGSADPGATAFDALDGDLTASIASREALSANPRHNGPAYDRIVPREARRRRHRAVPAVAEWFSTRSQKKNY